MADERRYLFQDLLEEALGSDQVYFQPPESVKMRYPSIVYERRSSDSQFADNDAYLLMQGYDVTVISLDPDFVHELDLPHKFKHCRSDRHFTADNLNHDTFVIYY